MDNDTCGAVEHVPRPPVALVAPYFVGISWFIFCSYCVFIVVTLIVFRRTQQWSVYLAKRSFFFTSITLVSSICLFVFGPLQDAVGPENFPCEINLIFRFVIVSLTPGPLVIRLIKFKHELAFARFVNQTSSGFFLQNALPSTVLHSPGVHTRSVKRSKSVSAVLQNIMSSETDVLPAGHRPSSGKSSSNHVDELFASNSAADNQSHIGSLLDAMLLRRSTPYATFLFTIFLVLPTFTTCIIFIMVFPWYRHGCTGCLITMAEYFTIAFVGLIVVCAGFWSGYKIRHERDPLQLIHEVWTIFLVAGGIGFPFVFLYFLDRYMGFVDGRGIFSYEWIMCFAMFIFTALMGPVQIYRAHQIYQANLHISVLNLESLIEDPVGLALFEEHCVAEFSAENIKFYLVAQLFHRNYNKLPDPRQIARQIYLTFIAPGSIMEVNIKSETREALIKLFGSGRISVLEATPGSTHLKSEASGGTGGGGGGGGGFDGEVFEEASAEIYKLMATDTLPRFMATDAYKEWRGRSLMVADAEDGQLHVVNDTVAVTPAGGSPVAHAGSQRFKNFHLNKQGGSDDVLM